MNEITRIHLAKTPYEVEIDAKKELEAYERALKRHLEDEATLEDIEVRMCELLTERGVQPNGVIALDDVKAVRAQLGEPADFGDEKAVAPASEEKPVRRLYRDLDNALLGGVMSGIAAYFKVDATLVRVLGIIILIISFGTFVPIYLLLWLLIPAARSASQRLELAGKPVTLETINQTGEATLNEAARAVRRGFLVLLGIGAIGVAIAAVAAIVAVVHQFSTAGTAVTNLFLSPMIFMVIAGFVFVMFMLVIAYSLLRQTWSKQLTTAMIIMILTGLTSFGIGAYMLATGARFYESAPRAESMKVVYYSADKLKDVKHIVIDSSVPVYYEIGEPKISVMANRPSEPIVIKNGDTVTVRYTLYEGAVVISGPKLDTAEVVRNGFGYTAQGGAMTVTLQQFATATIRGSLDSLQLNMKGNGAVFNGESLVVNQLNIEKDASNVGEQTRTSVDLATVHTLTITHPNACAAGTGLRVSLSGVTGQTTANGQVITAPFTSGCFTLVKAESGTDQQ